MTQRRHLILGPPGSGKTHALWHVARQLLRVEGVIPVFLAAGQVNRWEDLASMIEEAAPMHSIDDILQDPRVCVMIDGWSEFAGSSHIGERQKTLRALRNTRVIANGKVSDVSDTLFKSWSLELLAPLQVTEVLDAARPGAPVLPSSILDLLRLPLLLSIHVLSDATASAAGELLRQFHEHLARDLPEDFTAVLAAAVAASTLSGDRSYGRLILDLQARAARKGIPEPTRLLQRLGTIVERNGQALPIHDLYWSWLCGRGLIASQSVNAAIDQLSTRDSYSLALQSGARPHENDIVAAVRNDLVLAAKLDASLHLSRANPALVAGIDIRLRDSRLAVRNRGGLAALESTTSAYLKDALETLSAVESANLYVADWPLALQPQILFPQRAVIADWIGSKGTDFILDAIAERGDPEWLPWLEQMVSAGKVAATRALAAALGCSTEIPAWGQPHLDDLFKTAPWTLRAATARRSNLALGRHIASNYECLTTTVISPNSGAWIDLNRALVSCTDDPAFESLLRAVSDQSVSYPHALK